MAYITCGVFVLVEREDALTDMSMSPTKWLYMLIGGFNCH